MKINSKTKLAKQLKEGDVVKLKTPEEIKVMDDVMLRTGHLYVVAPWAKIGAYNDTITLNGKQYVDTELNMDMYTDAYKESGGEVEVKHIDDNDVVDVMILYQDSTRRYVNMWIPNIFIEYNT